MTSGRLRVALVYGGRSAERDVSLMSARAVASALDASKYDLVLIEIDAEGRWSLGSTGEAHPSLAEPTGLATGKAVDFSGSAGLRVALTPDGAAAGWVSLGPREGFDHLERSRVRPRLDDLPVWSIVCFVVGKRARRQGVGGQLLDAAIAFAREHGALALEAYPVDTSIGRPTGPTLYTGTLSTFLRAGFRVARPVESKQATVVRSIVRLDLR